jgi:hypothetical protein
MAFKLADMPSIRIPSEVLPEMILRAENVEVPTAKVDPPITLPELPLT